MLNMNHLTKGWTKSGSVSYYPECRIIRFLGRRIIPALSEVNGIGWPDQTDIRRELQFFFNTLRLNHFYGKTINNNLVIFNT